jgi:hypothetical protein
MQKIALAFFKEGEMLRDLQDNQIFKFDIKRDYHKVAVAPDRFVKHTTNKIKISFRSLFCFINYFSKSMFPNLKCGLSVVPFSNISAQNASKIDVTHLYASSDLPKVRVLRTPVYLSI